MTSAPWISSPSVGPPREGACVAPVRSGRAGGCPGVGSDSVRGWRGCASRPRAPSEPRGTGAAARGGTAVPRDGGVLAAVPVATAASPQMHFLRRRGPPASAGSAAAAAGRLRRNHLAPEPLGSYLHRQRRRPARDAARPPFPPEAAPPGQDPRPRHARRAARPVTGPARHRPGCPAARLNVDGARGHRPHSRHLGDRGRTPTTVRTVPAPVAPRPCPPHQKDLAQSLLSGGGTTPPPVRPHSTTSTDVSIHYPCRKPDQYPIHRSSTAVPPRRSYPHSFTTVTNPQPYQDRNPNCTRPHYRDPRTS